MVTGDVFHHQNGHVICDMKGIFLLGATINTIQKIIESLNFCTCCFERFPNLIHQNQKFKNIYCIDFNITIPGLFR